MAGPPTKGAQCILETEPAPTLGAQSRSPYLAVECAVSTLQAAGPVSTLQTVEPAPPLSRDSRKLGTSTSPSGVGGLLSVPPRTPPGYSQSIWGVWWGRSQPQLHRECPTRAKQGTQEHLTRVKSGGRGGNPRVSQLVPEMGATSQRSAGSVTQRGPCHARRHPRPIPGPQSKEEAPQPCSPVPCPSRTKPRPHGGTKEDELLEETEAETQTGR